MRAAHAPAAQTTATAVPYGDEASAPSATRVAAATSSATTAPAGTASQPTASAAAASWRKHARRKPSRTVSTAVLTWRREVSAAASSAGKRASAHQCEVHGGNPELRRREAPRHRNVEQERHAAGQQR